MEGKLTMNNEKIVKICTKCNVEYPATREYFPENKRCKDGFSSWCKMCNYNSTAIWQKKNRKRRNEWMKKRYKTLKGYIGCLINNIKQRCNNKRCKDYKYYGGRGIKLCFTVDELCNWFITNKINPRNKQIHRIDNNSNYTLDNIEFLSKSKHMKLHHLQNREI